MKKFILASVLGVLPLLGALPPSLYRKAQARSSDVMTIEVKKVLTHRTRTHRRFVTVRAKVFAVRRMSRRVQRGRWITIRYRMPRHASRARWGAAPTPRVIRGHMYRAYLMRHRWIYAPAAGARSFVPLDTRGMF